MKKFKRKKKKKLNTVIIQCIISKKECDMVFVVILVLWAKGKEQRSDEKKREGWKKRTKCTDKEDIECREVGIDELLSRPLIDIELYCASST